MAEEVLERLDLTGRDLSVTGAAEMKQLGEKYAALKSLVLQNCQLTYLENIVYFIELENLDLSRNLLQDLEDPKNEVLFFLKALQTLNMSYNYLTNVPTLIFNLARLTTLNVSNNNIAIISDEVGMLENLTDLDVSFNQLAFLPDTLIKLTKLSKLKINSNELKELPGLAPSLVFLNLNDNLLKALPPSIGILFNLRKLYVDNNELLDVPEEIGRLTALRELNLNYNQLIDLPKSLGQLKQLSLLDISDNLFEAKEWFDPEVPSLLNFIRTKTIKPTRNGKFKSKKRRQDTLRVLPTQRKAGSGTPRRMAADAFASPNDSATSSSSSNNSSNSSSASVKGSNAKSVPGVVRPSPNVFLKLFRFKNIDDVSIGDSRSIVMVDRVICDYHTLSAGDVYMLDTPDTIWIWVGPNSHSNELMKAKYVAEAINEEFGSNVPIKILDAKTMMTWDNAGEFWTMLGVLNESDVRNFIRLIRDPKALAKAHTMPLGPDGKQSVGHAKRGSAAPDAYLFSLAPPSGDKEALEYRVDQMKIYKFIEDSDDERVQIQIVSAGEPPIKSLLDSSSCLLLDMPNNPSVYVWAGAYASSESKSWALLKAEELVNRDLIDLGVERAIAWNMDDAETWDFKELFFDWMDVDWDPVARERVKREAEAQEAMRREMDEENKKAVKSVKMPLGHSRTSSTVSDSDIATTSTEEDDIEDSSESTVSSSFTAASVATATSAAAKKTSNAPSPTAAARAKQEADAKARAAREAEEDARRKKELEEAMRMEEEHLAAENARLEEMEKQLMEKRRKQATAAAAAAATEARAQAERRREQARKEAEEAEAKRKAERERAAAEAKAKREADAARAAEAQREAEEKAAEEARRVKKAAAAQAKAEAQAKAAADAKAAAEVKMKKAKEEKAAKEAEKAAKEAADKAENRAREAAEKAERAAREAAEAEKRAREAEEKRKKEAYEAAGKLMSLPPASKATPTGLIKNIEANLVADAKQKATIDKIWKAPTLDKAKLIASPRSQRLAEAQALAKAQAAQPQQTYDGPDTLGDLPENRGALLAAPKRAIGPQGRRAATTGAARQIESKTETASTTRIAVGGAFGLLRAVGGEAALAQRKERAEASSSSRSEDSAQIWQKGSPRLIWIKGRRKILLRLVPVSPTSLNSGDVFILDNGKGVLYQWNGKDSNRIAKGKAMDLAKNIKDKEYSGTAKVVVLEEGKTDTNVQDPFWKVMHGHVPNDEEASKKALPLPDSYADLKIKTAAEGGDDAEAEASLKSSCDLYKLVPGKKDRVEPELVASYPLKKDILEPEECYILDCVGEIYVWCGKSSPIKTRKQSLDVALKLMASRNDFWVAPILRELPGGESVLFREKFADWGYGPPIQMQKIAVGKNVAKKAETEKIDAQALYNNTKTDREEVMVDTTGNGEVHVWRIVDYKKTPVPSEDYGHFFAGDTYIILYKYKVGNREAFLVYYWQGRTATINEKGTSALLTIELDKEFKANGTAKEVRVVQNQEPKHFLLVFKDRYVIHAGKFIDHFLQNKTDKKHPSATEPALYEVCGSIPTNTRLVQVEATKAAFKSNASFLLVSGDRKSTYIWNGKFAPESFKASSAIFMDIISKAYDAPSKASEISEGSESSKFWKLLNDSDESYPKWSSARGGPGAPPARLFHASEASGSFKIHELPYPFSRDDLTRNDVYVVDAWDRIYLWQQKANPGETKATLETFVDYFEIASKARKLPDASKLAKSHGPAGNIAIVTAGKEPLVFTSIFMAWNPLPVPHSLDSPLESGTAYLAQYSVKFTYDDLVNKRYPAGVDTTRLEDLLEDDEFEATFEMDRAAFAALPGWQAQKIKRAKGLF